jgi:uncharacterized membrane protein
MLLAVVFGSAFVGGIGLRHLFVEQGFLRISALIEYLLEKTECVGGQVTVGAGFALLVESWRFILQRSANSLPSFPDFLADSEFTLAIANTYNVSFIPRSHSNG